MIWLAVAVLVVLGLISLFTPRDWILFGERWTLKDGDVAEPSDLYVLLGRAAGVVLLVVAVLVVFLAISADKEAEEDRTSYAWKTYTAPPALTSVPVSDDAEIRESEIALSQILPDWSSPGTAIEDTLYRHVNRIVVQEDPEAVRVEVMYVESPRTAQQEAVLDALKESALSQVPERGAKSDAAELDRILCSSEEKVSWSDEARVVHVPLDEPLGDREVLDLATGERILPVSDEVPEYEEDA